MSKDVKKKKSEETVQDEVKNQETDAKKEEACNCESECKADESQNTCEADESDKAEAQDESTESSKKKDPKDAVIEELQDRVKRQMAEFDNFRKRTEKEKSTMFEMGASDIIKKLLPIVDNFDRGFKSVTDEELETPFAKGMDMVHKQLLKMLEDADVKPIEALGGEFNQKLQTLLRLQQEPIAITAAMIGSYVDLYRVKLGAAKRKNYSAVHKDFGYKGSDYRLKRSAETAAHYTLPQLEACLQVLLELDQSLKSQPVAAQTLLETALCRLALAGSGR